LCQAERTSEVLISRKSKKNAKGNRSFFYFKKAKKELNVECPENAGKKLKTRKNEKN
jgi:hypothetical protein